jgi:hypothetical protein
LYLFCKSSAIGAQSNFPGATSTDSNGINSEGRIIGDYFDSNKVVHGYVAQRGKPQQ